MRNISILINRKSCFVLCVLLLLISIKSGAVTLNDGQYHILNYDYGRESIWVDFVIAENDLPTSLEIAYGGKVSQVIVGNTGRVIFNGGLATWQFHAEDNSLVTFLSGTLDNKYRGNDSSHLEMSGGTISEGISLNILSTATISGGMLGGNLVIQQWSALTLVGSDFAINGVSIDLYEDIKNYATYEHIYDGIYGYTGVITGTLADGSSLNNYFVIPDNDGESNANIYLIPEPCSLALLGLGGLAVFRRRRVYSFGDKPLRMNRWAN